jgi:hypothetical protein
MFGLPSSVNDENNDDSVWKKRGNPSNDDTALEYFLRIVEGGIKPLQSSKTPPGATLSYVILPLSIIFMIILIIDPPQ